MLSSTALRSISGVLVAALAVVEAVPHINAGHHKGLILKRQSFSRQDWSAELEPYARYRLRYSRLECDNHTGDQFFVDCCYPLLTNEPLSGRAAQCIPAPNVCGGVPVEVTPEDIVSTLPDVVQPEPIPQPLPVPEPDHDDPPPPPPQQDNGNHELNTGGFATFYEQDGVAGACGDFHGDYDMIGAIDKARYGPDFGVVSSECGRRVHITNTANGKSVEITIKDVCPTCVGTGNSIDLSHGAFIQIADFETGMVPIEWYYLS